MQGLGANTIYCGDGINDIAALAAADVGMAIGATDAVVAASLSTSRKSISGDPCCNMCLCVCAALGRLIVLMNQPRRHQAGLASMPTWCIYCSTSHDILTLDYAYVHCICCQTT
jgi:hypothetical protein